MTKTSGKRKQPVPKNKNKNGGSNSPDKRRRGSASWSDNLERQASKCSSRDPPCPATPTSPSGSPSSSKKSPSPSKRHHPSKWEPMAHTCGVCYSKTTSEKFKRTCFNKHEFVCDRFHKTLLRAGKQDHCSACVMEREMEEKRRVEMKNTLDVIEGLEAAVDQGGCCGNRKAVELRNHRAKYNTLTVNLFEIRANTERELQERKEGFLLWKAS